ncbi:MAG: hypothetical protein WC607_03570 [Candidatus Micrarchaeia archaeon]
MDAFSTLFYALFVLAGGSTLGYLVLRLSYPDLRVLATRTKFYYSLAASAALLVASVALDELVFSKGLFAGHYFVLLLLLCIVLLAAFKAVLANLLAPGELLIALPTAAFFGEPAKIRKMREIKARVLASQPTVAVAAVCAQPIASTSSSRAPSAVPVASAKHISGAPHAPVQAPHRRYEGANVFASLGSLFTRKPAQPKPIESAVQAKGKPAAAPKKTLAGAPKPHELTPEEEAECFAEQFASKTPSKAPSKAGEQQPRWMRNRAPAAAADTPEMQAFVDAVQKAYAGKLPAAAAEPAKPSWRNRGTTAVNPAAAQNQEFNLLVQDVYSQLKESKSAGIASSLSVAAPVAQAKPEAKAGKAAPKAAAADAGLSFKDLFGDATPSAQPAPGEGKSLFDELQGIAGGTAVEKKADSEFVAVKTEKGMGCPKCGAKGTRVVFCPYCGTGFCANCATGVEPGAESFSYSCPKCGESVTVKKKPKAS